MEVTMELVEQLLTILAGSNPRYATQQLMAAGHSADEVRGERFNVSRQTLREAFRLLEAENLVAVRRGARGGATILVPDGKVAARHVGFLLEYRGATLVDVYELARLLRQVQCSCSASAT
jgi:DNA-binding IscR family transcriptional regulator